jgi:hypothetical protein
MLLSEKIYLDWAKSYQEEIRKEVQMIHLARQLKHRASQPQTSGCSIIEQFLRVCGFGRRTLEKPVTPNATA